MKKLVVKQVAASVLASICSMAALAQDPNLGISPPVTATATAPGDVPSGPSNLRGSGSTRSGTWFSAVKFTGRLSAAAPQLLYSLDHFYTAPFVSTPTRYFAQLDLEPGVAVDLVTCVVNDSSASNDVRASLQKYTTNFSTKVTTGTELAVNSSTGTNGVHFFFVTPASPETISTSNSTGIAPMGTQYHLAVDIAQDTSFAGCWAWWTRQITPAPASASFTDVPTSHWAFRYIEAVKASTITTGCTATTYCPDNNVTRAEMATFLSRALGLNWTR